ncbi:MAG: tRNA pseudouridine(38-40) synthase TruA [Micrococcales bacterium]|nr:tRNA pseudouridine(38-40) synthase TruA [Micrococcales bacterium]
MNQAVDQLVDGLTRFRIDLSYDGTDFAGWAKQPKLRTVQGEVISVMNKIFGGSDNDYGLRVAGRTDAGVHAEHQVVHVDLSQAQLKRLGRNKDIRLKMNSLLDPDVRIIKVTEVPAAFHARYAATHRRYRYTIADSTSGWNPLRARYNLWLKFPLDLEAMQAASKEFLGLHDFAAFSKPKPKATTIRELRLITVSRNKALGNVIEIELLADAFAHNMVRSIVGALIKVGAGRATPKDVARVLKSRSRAHPFKVVTPEGLSLIEVGYPAEKDYANQVLITQHTRSLDDN